MSVSAALSSLGEMDFDLWANLYSFIETGLKRTMFVVHEAMD